MKKYLICVISIMAILTLTACSNTEESAPNNNTNIPNVVEQNNSSKVYTNDEMYGDLIKTYKKAIDEYDFENEITYDLVSETLLFHVARYSGDGVKLTYGFYDIDKNGEDELLVGADNAIGAIYGFNKPYEEPFMLFSLDTMERGNLDIYDNGVILSSGSGGAALHYYEFGKISSDYNYEILESIEEEYDESGTNAVYKDYYTLQELNYKSIDEVNEKYLSGASVVENVLNNQI